MYWIPVEYETIWLTNNKRPFYAFTSFRDFTVFSSTIYSCLWFIQWETAQEKQNKSLFLFLTLNKIYTFFPPLRSIVRLWRCYCCSCCCCNWCCWSPLLFRFKHWICPLFMRFNCVVWIFLWYYFDSFFFSHSFGLFVKQVSDSIVFRLVFSSLRWNRFMCSFLLFVVIFVQCVFFFFLFFFFSFSTAKDKKNTFIFSHKAI